MTIFEYEASDSYNKRSKFSFKNGNIESGMIMPFFPDEPKQFYFVQTKDVIEFQKCLEESNFLRMKEIAVPVELMDVIYAEAEE